MKDNFILDSNVLIYYYDISDVSKHKSARNIIDGCWKSQSEIHISSQTLSEFFSVTTKKKILSKKDALLIVSDIINFPNWIKVDFNHKTILEACKISEEYNMPYWDSLLAATMLENKIFNIYTENTKDFKIPRINTVNPFD